MGDLYTLLLHVLSGDATAQKQAEISLKQAEMANFPLYIQSLVDELANEMRNENTRGLAGLILKNCLDARDSERQQMLAQQWRHLNIEFRVAVKAKALQTLGSPALNPRRQAAQVISKIALIELPQNEWPELIGLIVRNVTTAHIPAELRQASLETLGYICEDIDADTLKAEANLILTALIHGMRAHEPSAIVRQTATRALINALEFVGDNFATKVERDVIMTVVCECINAEDPLLRSNALECVATIASLYY